MGDSVNHPDHYNAHPVCEAIDICEHLPFSLGNAIKYLWRAGMKHDPIEDQRKALWYLRRHGALLREEQRDMDTRFPSSLRALAKVLRKNPRTPPALRELFSGVHTNALVHDTLATTYAVTLASNAALASEPAFNEES